MDKIIFKASFGDESKIVELVAPNGAGSNANYIIMIDNFYCGSINYMMGGYSVYFNRPDEFTTADRDVLIDIVTNYR